MSLSIICFILGFTCLFVLIHAWDKCQSHLLRLPASSQPVVSSLFCVFVHWVSLWLFLFCWYHIDCFRLLKMGKTQTNGLKRQKTDISIANKLRIIEDIENGMNTREVMAKHNIQSRSTIATIRRSKQKIREKVAQSVGSIGMYINVNGNKWPNNVLLLLSFSKA